MFHLGLPALLPSRFRVAELLLHADYHGEHSNVYLVLFGVNVCNEDVLFQLSSI